MPLHSILIKTLLRTYYYFHFAVVKSAPQRGQPLCQGHRAGTGGEDYPGPSCWKPGPLWPLSSSCNSKHGRVHVKTLETPVHQQSKSLGPKKGIQEATRWSSHLLSAQVSDFSWARWLPSGVTLTSKFQTYDGQKPTFFKEPSEICRSFLTLDIQWQGIHLKPTLIT